MGHDPSPPVIICILSWVAISSPTPDGRVRLGASGTSNASGTSSASSMSGSASMARCIGVTRPPALGHAHSDSAISGCAVCVSVVHPSTASSYPPFRLSPHRLPIPVVPRYPLSSMDHWSFVLVSEHHRPRRDRHRSLWSIFGARRSTRIFESKIWHDPAKGVLLSLYPSIGSRFGDVRDDVRYICSYRNVPLEFFMPPTHLTASQTILYTPISKRIWIH